MAPQNVATRDTARLLVYFGNVSALVPCSPKAISPALGVRNNLYTRSADRGAEMILMLQRESCRGEKTCRNVCNQRPGVWETSLHRGRFKVSQFSSNSVGR